jgi:hypothetical protein
VVVDLPASSTASGHRGGRPGFRVAVDEMQFLAEQVVAGRVPLWITDADPVRRKATISPLAQAESWICDSWPCSAPPPGQRINLPWSGRLC